MLDDLTNLVIGQLLAKRRHVSLSVMDNLVQFFIAQLLHFFRAQIRRLQLFSQRSVSRTVGPMAKYALGFKGGRARRLPVLLRRRQTDSQQQQ